MVAKKDGGEEIRKRKRREGREKERDKVRCKFSTAQKLAPPILTLALFQGQLDLIPNCPT